MFNNLGPTLGMAMVFYANVAKGLKLKVRKFWKINPAFVEARGKIGRGSLFPSPILDRVNKLLTQE